jgi:hypothetical protein
VRLVAEAGGQQYPPGRIDAEDAERAEPMPESADPSPVANRVADAARRTG